jgi:hypothetical protein
MNSMESAVPDRPDYRDGKPPSKASLEINTTTVPGEIRDNEAALSDHCDDFIVDFIVMLNVVDPFSPVPRTFDGWLYRLCPNRCQLRFKPHGTESNNATSTPLAQLLQLVMAIGRDNYIVEIPTPLALLTVDKSAIHKVRAKKIPEFVVVFGPRHGQPSTRNPRFRKIEPELLADVARATVHFDQDFRRSFLYGRRVQRL